MLLRDNPVLIRELLVTLRSPRSFVLQMLYVCVLGALVYFYWPGGEQGSRQVSPGVARALFDIFFLGQFFLVTLMAPTFAAGTTVMIEGSLMDLSGTTFVVRGVTVDASASALATTVAALQDNQIVEVTGTIAGNGTLTATSIEVERYATFVMMGSLDSVSSSGFSLLGQSFSVTASTRFMDWAQGVRPFDSTDFASVLAAGNQVIVSGYPSGSGDVATRVERIPTPASPVAGVQGVVSADNAPTDTMMTVAGVTVTLNPACGPAASPGACTQLFYFGAGAMPTLAGFFGAITPNTAVAAAFGPPGSSAGTITAAAAAVLRPQARWMR